MADGVRSTVRGGAPVRAKCDARGGILASSVTVFNGLWGWVQLFDSRFEPASVTFISGQFASCHSESKPSSKVRLLPMHII